MGLNIFTLGSSKTYTRESLLGGGAVVGKNVTVSSITPIDGGNRVTFSYTLDDGTVKTSTMDVMDGKDGIDGTNGKNGKDGQPGKDGTDGIGISKIEKIGTVDLVDTYRITFTDNSTFDYEVTNGADGQGGTGASTWSEISDKPFESLSTDFSVENGELKVVGGTGGGEENVQSDWNETDDTADGFIKNKPTIPSKVSQLENDSNYLSSIPEEYVTETELSAKGYLTEHQDISGKVDKVDGKSLIADTEIERLASVDNYNDTQVKTQIQAVANGLMDSVGYSADYKTIDIIAKNGVKKSVNVAPIISHASITELSDVDTTNKATGKALVYNATTSKHEYADVSGTDEKVKMDASTDAKYLGELLDNVTIANENGELKVKKLDGQEVTITEINYLKGLTMNVMDLVNMFSNGGVKIINTPVATYAELLTLDKSSFIEGISYLVYVLADENHDNAKTTYLVDKDSETPTYFGFADSQRDFTTNPIDLATEITGKLGIANMDSDAIKALFTVDDTYKTETATNNAFSTHGAKALYDELLLAIGNKANSSDLTAHKDDTDIHVSTTEKDNWNGKADASDLTAHTDNAEIHVTADDKTLWNTVEDKVDKTDIVDNLTSTDIDKPLSANQGKILDDKKLDKADVGKITVLNANGVDIKDFILENCTEKFKEYHIISTPTCTDIPANNYFYMIVRRTGNNTFKVTAKEANCTNEYVRNYRSDAAVWTKWAKVCTTTVEDIPKTNIAPVNETTFVNFKGNSMCNYCVENGVCYVSLWGVQVTVTGRANTGVMLPLPKSGFFGGGELIGGGDAEIHAYAHTIPETGELKFNVKDANVALYGMFSYPVEG